MGWTIHLILWSVSFISLSLLFMMLMSVCSFVASLPNSFSSSFFRFFVSFFLSISFFLPLCFCSAVCLSLSFFLFAVLGFLLGREALVPVSGRSCCVSLGSPSLGGVIVFL